MQRYRKMVIGLALCAAPVAAHAQNQVVNGNFEANPGLAGWTTGGFSAVQFGGYAGDVAAQQAQLGSSTLSQTLSLGAGTTYNVSFDAFFSSRVQNGPLGTLSVQIGAYSQAIGPYALYDVNHVSFAYTAVSNSTLLSFNGICGNNCNPGNIDNVSVVASVTPGAVPEPATWAMMIFGFGAIGVAARRRARPVRHFAPGSC